VISLRKLSLVAALAAGVLLASAMPVQAAGVLLDRGLPTANLNDTAGPDRSNVRWWSGVYNSPNDYVVLGDSFTNNTGSSWAITKLRMWVVDEFDTVSLFGGKAGSGSYGVASSGFSRSGPVLYANGETYSDVFPPPGPNPWAMYEVVFDVNILLAAGETYQYFFDGAHSSYSGAPLLHASNAALSGSMQAGSDDTMLEAMVVGGVLQVASISSWSSQGNGWDKASDFNVQVIGNVVPAPATLALAGLALLAAVAAGRLGRSHNAHRESSHA
jgi:hypothetical protein